MAGRVELVREVDSYRQQLSIDIHNYEGWKVRASGYDGKSPMPFIFELLPGGKSAKACEPLYDETVAKYRSEGWSDELAPDARARIDARIQAVRNAEAEREADLARRIAAFPVTALDKKLAAAIAQPANVRELDLRASADDKLTVIPPSVKQLKELEVLHAEGNGLPEVPEELGSIKTLRELYLDDNALVDLPPDVRISSKNFTVLTVRNNRIERLYWKPKLVARYELGGNPLLPAIQGCFTHSAFGDLRRFSILSIDTDGLFPLDESGLAVDYASTKTFTTKSLTLYGRKPTPQEEALLAKYFPRTTITYREHVDLAADDAAIEPLLKAMPAAAAKKPAATKPTSKKPASKKPAAKTASKKPAAKKPTAKRR